DPNYDLLRALQIGDFAPIDSEKVEIGLVWVYTLRNNTLEQKRTGGEEYKMFVEWLPAGVETEGEIVIDEHLLRQPVRQQLGFKEEHTQLIEEFPQRCNERARLLMESEHEFYEVYKLDHAQRFYSQLMTQLQQVEQAGGFMLNIGWGGGWETKTVLNPLTEGLDNEYDQIRRLYSLGHRGG
ncbi:MAG: type III-A CRISPR-associated RAMP protein Csm5, partial [Fimbriimonadales bacterium]|nr:type III-A CRISPR-associated RAMP protein Csm5 [Fimbriimonadales bacterium]